MNGTPLRPTARVVLDTNVCLDLLLFHDPTVAALADALRCGRLQAVCDRDCRDEWRRVLGYPLLALSESEQLRLRTEYDGCFQVIETDTSIAAALPRCADADDQKFLEVAQRSGARWLLSRDAALLKLSRRVQRDHGFAVLTPQQWRSHL